MEENSKKKGAPDARTYYHKGNTYFEKKKYEKAIENYNMAIILNPTFSEAYFSRGLAYYNLKNFDKSMSDYTKSGELDPNNPVIYNNRGDAHYRKQEFDTAIKDYDKAIGLNPRYLKAYYNRGLSYACKQNYETAIVDFTKVIELNEHFTEAYHIRGLAYDYMDRLDDAIKDYDKALELNPNFDEAKKHKELAKSKLDGTYSAPPTASASGGGFGGPGGGQGGGQGGDQKGGATVNISKMFIKPSMTFDDIAGMSKMKESIRENIIYPMAKPELAERYNRLGGGGILLYGPPGCGKSYILKAAAGESATKFMNVKSSDILDQYVGGTEKNIHAVFEGGRQNSPCIMFFDEIDSVAVRRDKLDQGQSYLKGAVNQMLYELDGVEANNKNLLVIGATNAPWDVDPAIRRSGRLGKTIYIPQPDFISRLAIIKIHSNKLPLEKNITWNRLALATRGYASADLKAIADEAGARPWREAFKTGKERKINTSDFIFAINKKKSSLPPWYGQAKKQIGDQEEKTVVDGKEHVKVTESKMGQAEKDAFGILLKIIEKENKWYVQWTNKIVKFIGVNLPLPDFIFAGIGFVLRG